MSTKLTTLFVLVLGTMVAGMAGVQAASTEQICTKISGKAQLSPEPPGICTIDDNSGRFVGNPDPLVQPGCFVITLTGTLHGSGYGGITREQLVSLETGGAIFTPVVAETGLIIQTGRARLLIRGTTFTSTDMAIFVPDPASPTTPLTITEQVVMQGDDKGYYAGASVRLAALGNSIGAFVPYKGEICRDKRNDNEDEDED